MNFLLHESSKFLDRLSNYQFRKKTLHQMLVSFSWIQKVEDCSPLLDFQNELCGKFPICMYTTGKIPPTLRVVTLLLLDRHGRAPLCRFLCLLSNPKGKSCGHVAGHVCSMVYFERSHTETVRPLVLEPYDKPSWREENVMTPGRTPRRILGWSWFYSSK
jgi:hypothetical protein